MRIAWRRGWGYNGIRTWETVWRGAPLPAVRTFSHSARRRCREESWPEDAGTAVQKYLKKLNSAEAAANRWWRPLLTRPLLPRVLRSPGVRAAERLFLQGPDSAGTAAGNWSHCPPPRTRRLRRQWEKGLFRFLLRTGRGSCFLRCPRGRV